MSIINLTPEERERFATYLYQEAETEKGLMSQMETLPHMAPLVKHRRAKIAAMTIVARELTIWEKQTLE